MNYEKQVTNNYGKSMSHFFVASSQPNDIDYKLDLFLADVWNFHQMFGLYEENLSAAILDIPTINFGKSDSVSGYCSRTSSNVSDISSLSASLNKRCNIKNHELPKEEIVKISTFFSALSVSVYVCKTAARVYQLDDIYELGLRETCNRILNWKMLGEGVLFIKISKNNNGTTNLYLCLTNTRTCQLYFQVELSKESKLNSIRQCVKYLIFNDISDRSYALGLYFADESLSNDFTNIVHNLIELLYDNNDNLLRKQNFFKSSQLINWICNKKYIPVNQRKSNSKKNELKKSFISNPTEFEWTLHIPIKSLDNY